LERKPDLPDARQMDNELAGTQAGFAGSPRHDHARQSEFSVSAGGLNQESQHNKQNGQKEAGHKPQKH
jgi:hypothetical protein